MENQFNLEFSSFDHFQELPTELTKKEIKTLKSNLTREINLIKKEIDWISLTDHELYHGKNRKRQLRALERDLKYAVEKREKLNTKA